MPNTAIDMHYYIYRTQFANKACYPYFCHTNRKQHYRARLTADSRIKFLSTFSPKATGHEIMLNLDLICGEMVCTKF
jgi:hypothetical protein